VAEIFKTVIDEITHGTDFTFDSFLESDNVSLIHEDLITSIDELETEWNIHLASYDSLTS
jgi:hypothetical protein